MDQVQHAQSREQWLYCWEAVQALRPHLTRELYLEQLPVMIRQGYQLVYIAAEGAPGAAAIAGFRAMDLFYSGPIFYIDDLSTLPAFRGRGYAGRLLDYIFGLAGDAGKRAVHLDSGHQRHDAHRLYLNKRFVIRSHHFERIL